MAGYSPRGAGITRELLADKLGAFGGTPFHLGELVLDLPAGLHLPVSELKEIRRQLVPALEAALTRVDRTVETASVIDEIRPAAAARDAEPLLVALCRNDEQLDAVLAAGCRDVELDWMELVGLAKAVAALALGQGPKAHYIQLADRWGRALYPLALLANAALAFFA